VDTDIRAVRGIVREGKGCSLGEESGTRGHRGRLGSGLIVENVWIVTILRDVLTSFTSIGDLEESEAWVLASLPLVAILFGGIHCFAWRFSFPSRREVLWKVCAIYCTAYPAVFILAPAVPQLNDVMDCGRIKTLLHSPPAVPVFSPTILYVVCQVVLLVLTFTCLCAPPASIYEATSWTSHIPHFG
jgi:hypothetical protein